MEDEERAGLKGSDWRPFLEPECCRLDFAPCNCLFADEALGRHESHGDVLSLVGRPLRFAEWILSSLQLTLNQIYPSRGSLNVKSLTLWE